MKPIFPVRVGMDSQSNLVAGTVAKRFMRMRLVTNVFVEGFQIQLRLRVPESPKADLGA